MVSAASLDEALRLFQARHGLSPSGLVDSATREALNVTAEVRLAQLRASLVNVQAEFVSAASSSGRSVIVNIPGFYLEAVDERGVALRHRVVVGRLERPTPTVSAKIKAINFLPSWRVPDSIASQDLIPRLHKDPDYLARERIRVYRDGSKQVELATASIDWQSTSASDLKFKQDPGTWNALGLVRLDMPNEHNVYLHDTPLKDLFARQQRAFSAGCVRVEGVLDLAAWLLRETPGWSRAKIDDVLSQATPLDISLPRPVPVRFVYVTAWAGPDDVVEFREDIYGRDGSNGTVATAQGERAVPANAPRTIAP